MKDKDSAFLDDLDKTTDLLKAFKPRISIEASATPVLLDSSIADAISKLNSSNQSIYSQEPPKVIKKKTKTDILSMAFCALSIVFILSCIIVYGLRFIRYHQFF